VVMQYSFDRQAVFLGLLGFVKARSNDRTASGLLPYDKQKGKLENQLTSI